MSTERNAVVAELIQKSVLAKENAYCQYSNFRVGAALLTNDGQIFTGCNVENASYGLTICAERTAITKAVSEGFRNFTDLAVSSDMKEGYITPCGACRQFIAEFTMNCNVYLVRNQDDYKSCTMKELLPFTFDKNSLDQNENKHE